MLRWLSCSACRAKDQQLDLAAQRERGLWEQIQKLQDALIERALPAPPQPRPRPVREVKDQSEILAARAAAGRSRPPWSTSLVADGHVRGAHG